MDKKKEDERPKMAAAIGSSYGDIKWTNSFIGESTLLYFVGNCLVKKQFVSNEYTYFNATDLFANINYFSCQQSLDSDDIIVCFSKEPTNDVTSFYMVRLHAPDDVFLATFNASLRVQQMTFDPKTRVLYVLTGRRDSDDIRLLAFPVPNPNNKILGKLSLKTRAEKFVLHASRSKVLVLMSKNSLKLLELRT